EDRGPCVGPNGDDRANGKKLGSGKAKYKESRDDAEGEATREIDGGGRQAWVSRRGAGPGFFLEALHEISERRGRRAAVGLIGYDRRRLGRRSAHLALDRASIDMQDRQRETKREWTCDRKNQQNLALHTDLPNASSASRKTQPILFFQPSMQANWPTESRRASNGAAIVAEHPAAVLSSTAEGGWSLLGDAGLSHAFE